MCWNTRFFSASDRSNLASKLDTLWRFPVGLIFPFISRFTRMSFTQCHPDTWESLFLVLENMYLFFSDTPACRLFDSSHKKCIAFQVSRGKKTGTRWSFPFPEKERKYKYNKQNMMWTHRWLMTLECRTINFSDFSTHWTHWNRRTKEMTKNLTFLPSGSFNNYAITNTWTLWNDRKSSRINSKDRSTDVLKVSWSYDLI